jgi:hypothetical protein
MSATTTHTPVVLEPASQELVEATANPPFPNPLSATQATRAAVAQAIATLRQALHTA